MAHPERNPRRPPSADWRTSLREAGPYFGLGMQFALTIVFFTGGGYLLDRWLGLTPWLTFAGALLGMVALFVQLFRVSKMVSKRNGGMEEGRNGRREEWKKGGMEERRKGGKMEGKNEREGEQRKDG